MTHKQWLLITRFMFSVIYLLNRYLATDEQGQRKSTLSWQVEFDLCEEINQLERRPS